MIDFEFSLFSLKFRIGDVDFDSESKSTWFSRIKEAITNKFTTISDFVEFLKNDDEVNYRITYDEGHDAYMILYGKNYPEGFYGNSNNPIDYFYKSHDVNGNSIAGFVIPDVNIQHSVQRMEGLQITPTETLQSISVAEIYLTNCDESNIDPYIPLKITYSSTGIGTIWYGRNSKFERIPEYFEQFNNSLINETQWVNEWLDNYIEEEPDPIDLNVIRNREEMNNVTDNNNRRKKKRVQSNRN